MPLTPRCYWLAPAHAQTPLADFAREVVQTLQDKGPVDWHKVDDQGRSPLHHAAASNNT